MADESPLADQLHKAIIEEQNGLLSAAMAKLSHCLGQVSDDHIWWRPASDLNSIANLVLHVCGNLTQWIISGVGGAEDLRQRSAEFSVTEGLTRSEVAEQLDSTIAKVREVMGEVSSTDLLTTREIQGFEVTGLGAIVHSVTHFVGHTHQIIQITRLCLGTKYEFEWSPDGRDDSLPI